MDESIASATTMCGTKNIKKGGDQRRSSSTATMAMRKGPWTEEEDAQLVWFVRLFGERRWDFLAKVSGLKRTGKSCRLRWVNYLHPGLRRGRITADEEQLILELHAKWGSRWSRIARSLPGRTDNEIKNFWRTRMRKQKALGERQQKSTATAASPSSSSVTTAFFSGSPTSGTVTTSSSTVTGSSKQESNVDDDAELDEAASTVTMASQHQQQQPHQQQEYYYTMDQLWNELAAAEAVASYNMDSWGISGHAAVPAAEPPLMMPSSPAWEFCSDYSLWRIDDEEYYSKKMLDAP